MNPKSTPLFERFKSHIEREKFFLAQDKGILAVSGGVDSMVMADLFYRAGFSFALAHCNFSLRGEESDLDEQLVIEWAQARNIPVFIKRFNTRKYMEEEKISLQMAARELRYHWFEDLCTENQLDYYALAHHQNDVLETILHHLIRGTGIAGLRGMNAQNGKMIRPLLIFSREEILQESSLSSIPYREDRSNDSTYYIRNKIRKEIIPIMKEINPKLESTVFSHLSGLRWTEYLAKISWIEIRKNILISEDGDYKISKSALVPLGEYKAMALVQLLEEFEFPLAQAQEIAQNLFQGNYQSGSQFTSLSYTLIQDREFLFLRRTPIPPPASERVKELFSKLVFREILDPTELHPLKDQLKKMGPSSDNSRMEKTQDVKIWIDADAIQGDLSLRFWEEGDHFKPLGMKNSKKLSDFFIDQKIPVFEKKQIPLLIDQKNIIWVIGYRIHDAYRVKTRTQRILEIQFPVQKNIGV